LGKGNVASWTFEVDTFTVTTVAISTDGKKIVSGSADYSIKIWFAGL